MSGITSTGFVPKTLEEIETDLKTGIRGTFGASEDVEAESVWGQFIGIFSERTALVWQAIAAVYQASFPDGADGVNLINNCALTGVAQLPATYSTVVAGLTGTLATVIPADKIASVLGSGTQFKLTSPATLAAIVPWAVSTVYVIGNVREQYGRLWRCKVPGTSGTVGPTTDGAPESDSVVAWDYLGTGTGYVEVTLRAVLTGPKVAAAYTLTVIETPVSGWNYVRNFTDQTTKGTDLESERALRLRRELSLGALGSASARAIRSAVLAVTGVTDCFVFENDGDVTDADGIPPHAFEVVVAGGTNFDVAQAIYTAKGATAGTYGTSSQNVTDSSGFTKVVLYSRPVDLNIWATFNLIIDPALFPSNGAAQVKAAVVAWALLNIHTGSEVRSSPLVPLAFTIPGVVESTLPLIGLANPPTVSTTIVANNRQKAAFDTARIVVNTTNVT